MKKPVAILPKAGIPQLGGKSPSTFRLNSSDVLRRYVRVNMIREIVAHYRLAAN